jgi:hypothetical protein
VSAALVDPASGPLQGETIHFTLQSARNDDTLGGWGSRWTVDAETGSDGVARALLPTEGYPAEGTRLRVLATFDGGPDLWPRHAAVPVTSLG